MIIASAGSIMPSVNSILEKIHISGLKFLVPLTPEETYALIVHEGKKLLKTQYGSLFLMEKGVLNRVYASTPILHQIKIRKKGTTYWTFRNQKVNVTDGKILQAVFPQFKKLKVKSIVSIPLINYGKSIGVLSLQSTKEKSFTKEQLNTLKVLGSLASLAIRKTQLYDESKRAVEARDLFISMAAHELRTPVTTISGYAQLLYSKFAGSNTPEARWIADLSWETLRLTYLINELLEVDKIKSGQFQYYFKECSLKEIMRRATSDFRFTHPRHKIILNDKLKIGDVFIGDFDKILQMIINILDNSAKFSPPDSNINVELGATSSIIYLKIQDQGKGISQKDIPEIFGKYFRGSSELIEGMGIGLFLVKNIVKQHRGEIKIKSKEAKGTQVEVRLPRAKSKLEINP